MNYKSENKSKKKFGVIKMTEQSLTKKEDSAGKKVDNFLSNHLKLFIILIIVIVCGILGYIIGSNVKSKARIKNLSVIDEISYELINGSSALETAELDSRRATALEKLQSYVNKGGIVGARANMLCAELTYAQEKYEDSAKYWETVVAKSKKNYINPIANYNLGVCYEKLNDLEKAAQAYKKASDNEDFSLRAHASYSYGRVLEAKGDYKEAVAVYTALNDRTPNDDWAKLAKTRILILQIEGKSE